MIKGFWNGQLADFRVVVGIIGDEPPELKAQLEARTRMKRYLWFIPHIGKERQMVEVVYGGYTFYIDNADGTGVRKVTSGRGSPSYYHASVYPQKILHEVPQEHWQEFGEFICNVVIAENDEAWMAIDPIGYAEHKEEVKSLLAEIKKLQRK